MDIHVREAPLVPNKNMQKKKNFWYSPVSTLSPRLLDYSEVLPPEIFPNTENVQACNSKRDTPSS